jgi:hypothetical protein
VYRDGDAYAVYFAGWPEGHRDRGVTLAIAVGEWSEGSTASDRVSIGLDAWTTSSEIQFTVLDPEQSPWGSSELLGEMLPRAKALPHSALKEVFEVADHIVQNDRRIEKFLSGGREG